MKSTNEIPEYLYALKDFKPSTTHIIMYESTVTEAYHDETYSKTIFNIVQCTSKEQVINWIKDSPDQYKKGIKVLEVKLMNVFTTVTIDLA